MHFKQLLRSLDEGLQGVCILPFGCGIEGLPQAIQTGLIILSGKETVAFHDCRPLDLLRVEIRQREGLIDGGFGYGGLGDAECLLGSVDVHPKLVLPPQPGLVVRVQGDDLLPPAGDIADFVAKLVVGFNQLVQQFRPIEPRGRGQLRAQSGQTFVSFHQAGKLFGVVFRSAGAIAGVGDQFTIGFEQQDAGEGVNFVLFRKFAVLFLEFVGQLLFMREINLDEDELFLGRGRKRLFVKDLGLELLAPRTPVRAE